MAVGKKKREGKKEAYESQKLQMEHDGKEWSQRYLQGFQEVSVFHCNSELEIQLQHLQEDQQLFPWPNAHFMPQVGCFDEFPTCFPESMNPPVLVHGQVLPSVLSCSCPSAQGTDGHVCYHLPNCLNF